ncbi:solute carrier family 25, member 39/40 [Blastomyces parvus]|uniref:Solute carrier family 25, member 39/40 n=1 Tax=Blastomyces parvus TaxID=2060905 RepID=A0A2B7WWZ4_9EURO|nr:solute carrier family 25, member 39/40 [Blastomyces parvus]
MSAYAGVPARPYFQASYTREQDTGDLDERKASLHDERTVPMAASNASGNSGAHTDNVSAAQKMMSATWGSLLTSLLVTPLDVVRVRLQSQTPVLRASPDILPPPLFGGLPPNLGVTACCREVFWVGNNAQFCMVGPNGTTLSSPPASGGAGCAVEETQRRTFTSTLDGLRKIARNEGPLSLWRGLSPTLVMAIPANVIYFTGYDWLRYDQRSPIHRVFNDTYAPLVAGGIARIAAASVISPIEMFRTRLQATSGTGTDHFKATLRQLHQMTQTQGYSSLWRGLTLTMWRDVPFSALYWWGYESVKTILADMRVKTVPAAFFLPNHQHLRGANPHAHQDNTMTFLDSFVAGATSGALAAFITTPFDVGKTRQQVFLHCGDEPGSKAGAPAATKLSTASTSFSTSSFSKFTSAPAPSSASAASAPAPHLHPEQLSTPRFLLHIFKVEGVSGLFRGWAARCLKVAPACAIMISSYEVGKKMAGKVNEHQHLHQLHQQQQGQQHRRHGGTDEDGDRV